MDVKYFIAVWIRQEYRVFSHLLSSTVQLNVSYYGIKQDLSNVDNLMHAHICLIYLYDWTLKNLAYCHNKTHLIEQSFSVASFPPYTGWLATYPKIYVHKNSDHLLGS